MQEQQKQRNLEKFSDKNSEKDLDKNLGKHLEAERLHDSMPSESFIGGPVSTEVPSRAHLNTIEYAHRQRGFLYYKIPTDWNIDPLALGQIKRAELHLLSGVMVSVSRNIKGYRLPPAISRKERRELLMALTLVCEKGFPQSSDPLLHHAYGTVYPLDALPDGMGA
jgi:hypothetical protein